MGKGALGAVAGVHQAAQVQKTLGGNPLGHENILSGGERQRCPGLPALGGELLDHLDCVLGLGPDLHPLHQLKGVQELVIGGLGGGLFPGQGVLEGEGDQGTAPPAKEKGEQADQGQGDFEAKLHRGTSRR